MGNDGLLDRIFADIYPEKSEVEELGESVFDLTDEFIKKHERENIAEVIYISSLNEKNILKISRLFDVLIWSTEDNGSELLKTTHEWMKGNNKRKIQIVLNMKDVFPISDANELKQELERIMELFPDLKDNCKHWLESR